MRKLMLSFFTLLLFAAATTTTTAVAQESKPKLAVLVVGMNDWMIGDVLAHLVGEELNRGNTYDVVTRANYVQNKLEALRRGTDRLNDYPLRAWATEHGISNLCVVTPASGFNFSLRLLDVSSWEVLCSGSSMEPNAVALKQLAWSLTGSMGSSCTPFGFLDNHTESLIDMELVYVEGGQFRMGCAGVRDGGENGVSSGANGDCDAQEEPDHDVTVGSFWIGKHEVTQAQWEAVMGTTIQQQRTLAGASTLYGVGPNYPMYYVSWNDAKAFCDTLSARTGKVYRLPTEEEWEYAARGGKSSAGYVYSGGNFIGSVAWYSGNTSSSTLPVGAFSGNELGIRDMSGNVNEWCSNVWRSSYSSSPSGSYRVIRGGSWDYAALYCRVANRGISGPSTRDYYVGFRVVLGL
jgi:formylglycine-generating enzyme required for sulfatase activity